MKGNGYQHGSFQKFSCFGSLECNFHQVGQGVVAFSIFEGMDQCSHRTTKPKGGLPVPEVGLQFLAVWAISGCGDGSVKWESASVTLWWIEDFYLLKAIIAQVAQCRRRIQGGEAGKAVARVEGIEELLPERASLI